MARDHWGKGRDSNPHKGTVALRKLASCGKLKTHSRTLRTRVASQCIRNPRRFLTCAIPARFAGDQVFRCAYPFALPNPFLFNLLFDPRDFRRKSPRVLVTCAGLEPANRQLERLFARPLRVARHALPGIAGVDYRNRTCVIWLEARCLSHSAKPTIWKLEHSSFAGVLPEIRTPNKPILSRLPLPLG
jgi:hypothetical protein